MTVLRGRGPIVVGGCGRSGTTLLRVILDTHPSICCGPESGLLCEGNRVWKRPDLLAEKFEMPLQQVAALAQRGGAPEVFAREFFEAYRQRCSKRRWADKTPKNVRCIAHIFETVPGATFLHVVRDGRDVACSLRTHPRYRVIEGQRQETGVQNPFEDGVRRWVQDVEAGIAFRGHERYSEVRYEDVVFRPETTLRRLFEDLQEPWDPAVLAFADVESPSRNLQHFPQNVEAKRPIFQSSVGRWRKDFSEEDLQCFERIGGKLLTELGYR